MCLVAFTPGMNNITALQNGMSVGIKKSYPFNLGVYAGRICVNIFLIFVGTDIFARFPVIIPALKVVCVIYLSWMAYQTVRMSYIVGKRAFCTSFKTAFGLQFINVKSIFATITAMIAFVYPYYYGFWTLITLAIYIALFAFIGTLCWTIFGNVLQKSFQKQGKLISWIMAILLLYTCYTIVK
ncbi:MAG: LysE family transporter [Brevinema sp.]